MTNAALTGMAPYPVQLEVSSPARFDRIQLLVRLGIAVALGWLGITAGWLAWLLFLVLPVIAAIAVSTKGADYYLNTTANKMWPPLMWLFSFSAYMMLITDEIPIDKTSLRTELHVTGTPSISSALARIVTSIPSAIVLCLLGFVSCVLWLVALGTILIARTVPTSIVAFQTGFLRWQARLIAYHASFVEEYPPFSFGDRSSNLPTAMVNP